MLNLIHSLVRRATISSFTLFISFYILLGKTAAFLLPVMERILQRGGGRSTLGLNAKKKASALAATRCLILTPTRELAAQCVSMMTAIAKFTDLRCALIVGGAKNVMSQVGAQLLTSCSMNCSCALVFVGIWMTEGY